MATSDVEFKLGTVPGKDVTVPSARMRVLLDAAAVLGAAFVGYQAWGFVAWFLSGEVGETSPASQVPDRYDSVALSGLLVMWLVSGIWTVFLVRDYRRRRSFTWAMLVTVTWTLTVWQESLANVTGPRYSWNEAMYDVGDWTPYLPFVPDDGPGLTMPVLMEPFVFFGFLSVTAFAIAALMRWLHSRGITRGWVLALVTYAIVLVLEFGIEMTSIAREAHAYPAVWGPLAVFDGTRFQFPLQENWLLGLMWTLPALAVYFLRDARGGKDVPVPRWRPGRLGTGLTCLAAVGLLNLAFLLYNLIAFVWLPADTMADLPPWLTP